MDEKTVKAATEKAGISSFSLNGDELWLYHGGAARKYEVASRADLDAAIAEFHKNVPGFEKK